MRGRRTSVRVRTELCARKTVIPCTIICVFKVGRIRVYRLKCDSLEMFGTTSWEQYRQVFDAIVRSNGWDNDTAALQLFSHLEGDALNVVHW